jgi:hypothetical protein
MTKAHGEYYKNYNLKVIYAMDFMSQGEELSCGYFVGNKKEGYKIFSEIRR